MRWRSGARAVGACGRRELIDRLKQLLNLGVCQDARTESAAGLCQQRSVGDVGAIPEATQVPGELAHEADAALLRPRALMGLLGEPLPHESSGQLTLHQPLGGEIAIKTPE